MEEQRKPTERDKYYLKRIERGGVVTLTIGSSGPTYSIRGQMDLPSGRFRRLAGMGLLIPNNDGLLDGCSQTFVPSIPDGLLADW